MLHRKMVAVLTAIASLVLLSTTTFAAPKPHDPFPPPMPQPTNYCKDHACTLLCVRNGHEDPDNGSPASNNASLAYVNDAAGNAVLQPVEHSVKLPHWWYIHQPVTSTHVIHWLDKHPGDYYYGQPPAFIHWDCSPYGIMFHAETTNLGGYAHTTIP